MVPPTTTLDVSNASLAATGGSMTVPAVLPVVLAAGLAAVHLFAYRLLFLDAIPRSRWLSVSGGSAVAYVFVHLLPELQHRGAAIEESGTVLVQFERSIYLVALLGFTAFYGLEQFARRSADFDADADADSVDGSPAGVFWVHIGSFALYNALIGYLLLHREETGVESLLLFFVAMALHFLVNDYSLREHHGRTYRRYARWILAAAVFAGLAVGYVSPVSDLHLAVLFAFLAGSIVLNVIKEELPNERESRFWAFAAGVVGYSALLLVL